MKHSGLLFLRPQHLARSFSVSLKSMIRWSRIGLEKDVGPRAKLAGDACFHRPVLKQSKFLIFSQQSSSWLTINQHLEIL
jgi:hypothetical protein